MSQTPTDVTFVDVVLTCHTEGCGNADQPITLSVPNVVTSFACGACSEPITDVQGET